MSKMLPESHPDGAKSLLFAVQRKEDQVARPARRGCAVFAGRWRWSAEAAGAFRPARDADVLLSVDRKRNRRPHLRHVQVEIEQLFAGIGAECQQPVVHAGEDQISGCGETAASERTGSRSCGAPTLFSGDRI